MQEEGADQNLGQIQRYQRQIRMPMWIGKCDASRLGCQANAQICNPAPARRHEQVGQQHPIRDPYHVALGRSTGKCRPQSDKEKTSRQTPGKRVPP